MDADQSRNRSEILWKAGALAGAAAVLTLAARHGTARGWIGATAVAVPLATRGVTGRWPMKASALPTRRAVRTVVGTLVLSGLRREVDKGFREFKARMQKGKVALTNGHSANGGPRLEMVQSAQDRLHRAIPVAMGFDRTEEFG
jgi:hypothetical protein